MRCALLGLALTNIQAVGSAPHPVPTIQPQCQPHAFGDYVHVSGTDASGHGWWTEGTCSASSGFVTVQLQDLQFGNWHNVGTAASGSIPAGGGSGNRITARAACVSNAIGTWRSYVNVDVSGPAYGSDLIYTPAQNIACDT